MQVLRPFAAAQTEFVSHLLRSRTSLISAFLVGWLAILSIVLLIDLVNAEPVAEQSAFGRNLLLVAGVLGALWQNRAGRPGAAMVTVTAAIFLVVTFSAFEVGLQDPATILDRYFVPTVLAGLMLNRRALLITGGTTIGAVAGLLILQATGLQSPEDAGLGSGVLRTTLQFIAVYVTVLVVLDQFGVVARGKLARAAEREMKLLATLQAQVETERQLDVERGLNAAIVKNMPGFLMVLDGQGNVLLHNSQREKLVRPAVNQAPGSGLQLSDLLPEVNPELLQDWLDETATTGTTTRVFHLLDARHKLVPYTIQASRLQLADRSLVIGIGLDTSELNHAKQQIEALNIDLQDQLQRLSSLRQIDQVITGSSDLRLTLDLILAEVAGSLAVDAGSVLLYKPGSDTLEWGAEYGFCNPQAFRDATLKLGEGAAGKVGLNREMKQLRTREELIREFVRWPHLKEEGFSSYLAVPLVAKGKLQGVLEFFHRRAFDIDEDWLDYLDALATQVAIAVDNAALFEGLEQANTELLQAYDTTIEGWSRALDLRDHETEGHSRRVTDLTLKLGTRLGASTEELVHMRRGALLHDIGKMGVPDSILLKTGRLNDEERALMQEHPNLAHDLLSPIRFLWPALDIPYFHHEKWDGSGYPQGLTGEMIPKAARVFALADVYDALTSNRPYREAWTKSKALEWIEGEAGRHFDPRITEEFIAMMKEG